MTTILWVLAALFALAIGFVCGVAFGGMDGDPIKYRNNRSTDY
jgi:hypothetical protein